ncbi:MAG: cytochrome c [Zavarzinella sp.]|nr:cytochrome c [Zavarzinella sp.]
MMRFSLKMGLLAVIAAGVAYLGSTAAAEEVKPENIKGCMVCQNKFRKEIGAQAKKGNWESVQKQAKDWVDVAKVLGTQKPPKGDEKSWKDQTDKYLSSVQTIETAAEKKDADGVNKGLQTIGASCMGCHSKHRAK